MTVEQNIAVADLCLRLLDGPTRPEHQKKVDDILGRSLDALEGYFQTPEKGELHGGRKNEKQRS